METLKNFFIGLFVILLSLIIIALVFLAWPVLIGISSFLLTVLAGILFVVLLFYIVVLVGHLTRQIITRK
ncbi:MAG: hypothetical protein GF409_01665 [Candidatus Omnitrophica bacterium]|nr:hypothetical protein [Candidatus Omnitrophota bacterium]